MRQLRNSYLIPLNGSAESEAILESATAFGKIMESRYTLLRIVEPFMLTGYDPVLSANAQSVEAQGETERSTLAYLKHIADGLRQQGLEVDSRVVFAAHAATAILSDAEEHHVDAIALATHARHGLSRLLLGSTADKVLRGTHLPLLMYHPHPTGHHPEQAEPRPTEFVAHA